MSLCAEIDSLLEGKKDVDWYVQKAFKKQMDTLKDDALKDWLNVPQLTQKEQDQAFDLIRKKSK